MQCPHCGKEIPAQGDWGREMRELRQAQGLGVKRVCAVVGYSQRYVIDNELGLRPKPAEEVAKVWEAYLTTGEVPEGGGLKPRKNYRWIKELPTGRPPGRPRRQRPHKPDDVFLDQAAASVEEV
jgi:transcriptional regulator with XRE-family HTH domain